MEIPPIILPRSGLCPLMFHRRPLVFHEHMNHPYLIVTEFGGQAAVEHHEVAFEFGHKYPFPLSSPLRETEQFAKDLRRLCAYFATIHATLFLRERLRHDDLARAAHTAHSAFLASLPAVDAMLELMRDDFVHAWGPYVSEKTRRRRRRHRRVLAIMCHRKRQHNRSCGWGYTDWNLDEDSGDGYHWAWADGGYDSPWGWGSTFKRRARQSDCLRPGIRSMGRTHRESRPLHQLPYAEILQRRRKRRFIREPRRTWFCVASSRSYFSRSMSSPKK
ncbi:hypothetical protein C8R43DRAFT_1123655 [Mycena crocata]|nr:hypothetical protein C8R43DRAFT_1123655 [Mycena crocata]